MYTHSRKYTKKNVYVNLPSINVRNIFVQRLDIEIFQSKLVQQQEDMRPLFAISVIEKGKL